MDIKLHPALSFYQMGQRNNQEDARYPDTDSPSEDCRTFIVCDGVGGLEKGEIASRTVAQRLGAEMQRFDGKEIFTNNDFAGVLASAYGALDERNTGESSGMATTLTFLHFHAGGVFAAYIGDSRIYQIREGVGIVYRSYDHSLVNVLVRTGNLSPADAIDHPQSNIITRCMGGPDVTKHDPANTITITDVQDGDYFLLCSDGVLHQLTDEQLVELICTNVSDREKMTTLARIASTSSDNNTAILVHVDSVCNPDIVAGENTGSDDVLPAGSDTHIITVQNPQACDVHPQKQADENGDGPAGESKIRKFLRGLFSR